MTTAAPPSRQLDDATVARYREDGFVHVPQVLTTEEVATYRAAVQQVYETQESTHPGDATFTQVVNVWESNEALRDLTFHPVLAQLATELAGIPLRIWHDQLLAKKPHNGAATEFHQDGPYWPHDHSRHSLSAWIALVDVPVERGCMSFIPGRHDRHDIRAIDLRDATDLFDAAPDLAYEPRVTIPLRAGDVTFHHAYTPHTANANDTDEFRWAFVNIYVDRDVLYNGESHPCTDTLDLRVDTRLPDEHFPPVP
ncbi:Phytanoyl-CoA dioxygenase [Beutenbergia cavernae DSM 12333]|uniref:Phytanoyl-CoA dioxygenase n=1 Tax=Beutenbergia cavernae (strain ATCC BAA-8 / DSM 12333 / CCUG 43141 / JCM 11478 / NBRC 16432 / NCIMB 13614 / HKI 0122) TaxID=471853 RepID=C5C1L6_BEUC1|nr:phytanoyl-CoA dioxygenase family protein [Beutenbergia cavernae]ACQ79484.1 Phytanoyl-CoA dioxygenase [Beutenbergia cavernae DSM 12333]